MVLHYLDHTWARSISNRGLEGIVKIQMSYDVPDGNYCLNVCEDKNMTPKCRYLHNDSWCALFGSGPEYEGLSGHSILRKKLFSCRRAEVKPLTTEKIPE